MLRLLVVFGLLLGLSGAAEARRHGALRPRLVKIGAGTTSKVYLSRSGKRVVKRLRPRVGGVLSLSPAERDRRVRESVEIMTVLRSAGLPVPRSRVGKGSRAFIVQDFAGGGERLGKLPWRTRPRAIWNAFKMIRRARSITRESGHGVAVIDSNPMNFRFEPDGTVLQWFDPVIGTTSKESNQMIKLLLRSKIRRSASKLSRRLRRE